MWYEPLKEFFMSQGAAGGAIGGLLVIFIGYFVPFAKEMTEKRWHLKILYVSLGILFCAAIDYSAVAFEFRDKLVLIVYVLIGASWPWVFVQFKAMLENYVAGKRLRELGEFDIKDVIEKLKANRDTQTPGQRNNGSNV